MTNIEYAYIPGRNLYAVDELNGQFWNTVSLTRQSFNSANWAHYAIPLTEYTGSGIYAAAYPTQLAQQLATQIIFQQNGVTPTLPGLPGGDSFLSIGQSQGANVQTVAGNGAAASNLGASLSTEVQGTAVSGTLSTTQMTTDLTNVNNGAFVGRTIYWTSGALLGMASNITGYTTSGAKLTYTAVPIAPTAGDTFVIA